MRRGDLFSFKLYVIYTKYRLGALYIQTITTNVGKVVSCKWLIIPVMPMDENYTLYSTSEFATLVRKALKKEKLRQPKESTVKFLKDFARNYRVESSLPEGLQGYMLS